jgi:hypothetical protein
MPKDFRQRDAVCPRSRTATRGHWRDLPGLKPDPSPKRGPGSGIRPLERQPGKADTVELEVPGRGLLVILLVPAALHVFELFISEDQRRRCRARGKFGLLHLGPTAGICAPVDDGVGVLLSAQGSGTTDGTDTHGTDADALAVD